jgi:hypothetical protein
MSRFGGGQYSTVWRIRKRGNSLHGSQPRITGNECNDAPFAVHQLAQLEPETATKTILQVELSSPPVDQDPEHETGRGRGRRGLAALPELG